MDAPDDYDELEDLWGAFRLWRDAMRAQYIAGRILTPAEMLEAIEREKRNGEAEGSGEG